ncbi:hypothetical protein BKK80_01230 [Cupriavidus malaysiensis]|uniref:Uncharacterized protein n=1 Tax=Cupriavidus malaysiensis TaxID=367825 RepID=A0ABN4TBT9_9BURK|nr:hypothetical protein BKK80_01230 [Cupriavidus malaysiensis]
MVWSPVGGGGAGVAARVGPAGAAQAEKWCSRLFLGFSVGSAARIAIILGSRHKNNILICYASIIFT